MKSVQIFLDRGDFSLASISPMLLRTPVGLESVSSEPLDLSAVAWLFFASGDLVKVVDAFEAWTGVLILNMSP